MRVRHPVLVLSLLGLAACGGDDGSGSATTDPAAATTEPTRVPTTIEVLPCADVPDAVEVAAGELPPAVAACTPPEDLVVQELRAGTGPGAVDGDTLFVDYIGMVVGSGDLFDTSYAREIPFEFPLGRGDVIAGWDEGLVGAQVGELLRLDVPNALAYGDTPPGDIIQPGDALSFVIEVLALVPGDAEAPDGVDAPASIGATELSVTDVVVGDGPEVGPADRAVVHLLLVRGDNKVVLYDTWALDAPVTVDIAARDSLPGIVDGLVGARVGGVRVLAMPPDLAYGPGGQPAMGLPRDTDLIVVVQVYGVV